MFHVDVFERKRIFQKYHVSWKGVGGDLEEFSILRYFFKYVGKIHVFMR